MGRLNAPSGHWAAIPQLAVWLVPSPRSGKLEPRLGPGAGSVGVMGCPCHVHSFFCFFESGKPFISYNLPLLDFRLKPLLVLYLEAEGLPYGRLQIPTR